MDDCDTNITIVCSPASGSTFPLGTNLVMCTATDDAGNSSAACVFNVTVVDNQDPTIAGCPANIMHSADAGQCSAAVTWIERWPGSGDPNGAAMQMDSHRGAIDRVASDATAYVHRDALFSIQYLSYWSQ